MTAKCCLLLKKNPFFDEAPTIDKSGDEKLIFFYLALTLCAFCVEI